MSRSLSRSESTNSMGSAGTGASGDSDASHQGVARGEGIGPDDMLDQTKQIREAVFGTMYSILQHRWESVRRYVALRFTMEHLQLLVILLQPTLSWDPDAIGYDSSAWQAANYVLLRGPLASLGWTPFLALMYTLLGLVALIIAGGVWAGYTFTKYNLVPNKWPMKVLRLLACMAFHVFYVTLLNYFLAPVSCQFLVDGPSRGRLVDFPDTGCFKSPVHFTVGLVMSVLVAIIGGLFAFADVTGDMGSRMWLANAHAAVELKSWAFKTAIVLSTNLLVGSPQAQSAINLIAAGWLAYVYLRWEPYYYPWANHLRVGCYSATAFVAFVNAVMVWPDGTDYHQATTLALGLLPIAALMGMGASYLRLELSVKKALDAFRMADLSTTKLRNVYRFMDEWECELAARCCRKWVPFEDTLLVPEAVHLAELVVQSGVVRFAKSTYMSLVHVGFLMDIQNNPQSGHSQLQAMRKLAPNLLQQYMIFLREQQHMAVLQSQSGTMDGAVDLMSYVEFQRNYKQALRAHKASLFAQRAFWKLLLSQNVPFKSLVRAFAWIETCRQRADHTYKMVVERYPKNVKVLRAYARFVEDVKNDPWSASRIYAEADKIEDSELHAEDFDPALAAAAADDGAANGGGAARPAITDKNSAVVTIDASGIVQVANKAALKMFGYKKSELEGKNVSILMPNPFSSRHNSFLHNYLTTGEAKVLDSTRQVVALHKDKYVFPVTISVSKVSGSGSDTIFMGVLRHMPEEANTVRAWLTPGGIMLCVDQRFADWLGKTPAECVGKPFAALACEPEDVHGLIDRAGEASEYDLANGRVTLEALDLGHKFANPVKMQVTLEMGGTASQRLLVAVMKKADGGADHFMVVDQRGRVQYATGHLAELLGLTPKLMVNMEFSKFMAQPFQQLHAKWMKQASAKIPLCSCRNGAPVVLISTTGQPTPAKLQIVTMERGDQTNYVVKVKPTTFPDALSDRRLSLHIDSSGNITAVSDSPSVVFGFRPQKLVGRNLNEVIDVFEGIPLSGDVDGMDMQQLLSAFVHRTMVIKDSSWRVGVHPPLSAEERSAVKSNGLQAHLLASQTHASVMQFELLETDEDSGLTNVAVHLWRSEMLTGVVELDKEGVIQKAGCCALHQPGILFGVPSNSMLQTYLSQWVNVPQGWDALIFDGQAQQTKKKGALKRTAADVKIGPCRSAQGNHNDGQQVFMTVQAVVKEGPAPPRLVVKLTIEKPTKGHTGLLERILRQHSMLEAVTGMSPHMRSLAGSNYRRSSADGPGPRSSMPGTLGTPRARSSMPGGLPMMQAHQAVQPVPAAAPKPKAMLRFQGSESDGRRSKPGTDLAEGDWVPPPPDEDPMDMELLQPMDGQLPPEGASQDSGGDMPASAGEDATDALYQSDFKRGKRLRKLARVLDSKRATKAGQRFRLHTILLVLGVVAAHLACFVATVVLIDGQKMYIAEADNTGSAIISLHKITVEARVLEALYKGQEQPGIFVRSDVQAVADRLKAAADDFEEHHADTFFGTDTLRRMVNIPKYPLQDYWEGPSCNVSQMLDIKNPKFVTVTMGAWQLGMDMVSAAREVVQNHASIVATYGALNASRDWQFIAGNNGPFALYNNYKNTLYGLVVNANGKIGEVAKVMVVLLVLEGCVLFLLASIYITVLMRQMTQQRHNLFSVFLVIPTGFLRALASKQVQLDEDEDSDNDSDAGDIGNMPDQQQEGGGAKLALSLPGKKGKKGDKEGALQAGSKKQKPSWGRRLLAAINPAAWLWQVQSQVDTGKKQLQPSFTDTWRMTGPVMLFGMVLAVLYGWTYQRLAGLKLPFQQLNLMNVLVFRATRNVLFSLNFCLATTDADKKAARALLPPRLTDMMTDYNGFLYGAAANNTLGAAPILSTDGALFQSPELADTFFRETICYRQDLSTCYPETHKFYEVTHHGLDAIAVRFMQEVQSLMNDPNQNVNLSNSRLEYIWQVGQNDLFDGLITADMEFRTSMFTSLDQLRLLHIIVFLLALVGSLLFLVAAVRPFLTRTGKETRQIAEMLSQLPNDMDLEGLLAQALGQDDEEDDDLAPSKAKGADGPLAAQQMMMWGQPGMMPGGYPGYPGGPWYPGMAQGGEEGGKGEEGEEDEEEEEDKEESEEASSDE